MPGRNSYNGQSIRTRFFILGLPLFPTGCIYKISDNLGIDIPLTGKDILHAYAKIHLGLLGVVGLFWMSNLRGSEATMKPLVLLLSLALLGLSIYSWMKHSAADSEEEKRRRIFGNAFLYNMSPEYLPKNVQKSLFSELLKIYFGKFTKLDWQEDIRKGAVNKSNFHLLYTLAYYQKTLEPTPTHQALFTEIAAYLNKERSPKTNKQESNNAEAKATVHAQAHTTAQPQNVAKEEPTLEKVFQMMQDIKTAEGTTKTENTSSQASFSTKTAGATNPGEPSTEPMVSADIFKLQDAKQSIIKQLALVAGFFVFGFVIMAVITANKSLLGGIFVICLVIYGVISAIVFLPNYLKIGRDIANRKKIKIKVRIKDMAEEAGTAYFILQPNRYRINKLTAPSKYYSTQLLNKELEIYVGKESHALLDIVGVRY